MPIFDFICPKCNARVERLINSRDVDKQECRACGGVIMERQQNVSDMSFALKGIWFKTHKHY